MKIGILLLFISIQVAAQQTENVILITMDGLRWQELFKGADSLLVGDSGYVNDPEDLVDQYWNIDPLKRREILMPFFWKTIGTQGQVFGNRKYENKVNCKNQLWFSYPGYNEILTGYADDERITSNDKINNPNVTILELVNNEDKYNGKVAAFASWDVFPYIINEERSGVPVNAGFDIEENNPNDREILINELQSEVRSPWSTVRLDPFTHHYAMEYLKKNKPNLMYISYGETDDWAHGGKYDEYLFAATQTDRYLEEIWSYLQSDSQYKDKTTLIITTDHGRGTHPKDSWRNHGSSVPNGGEIWIAMIGPEFKSEGEVLTPGQLYQDQVAATIAKLLGVQKQEKMGDSLY